MPVYLDPATGERFALYDGKIAPLPPYGGSQEGFTPYSGAGTFASQIPEAYQDYKTTAKAAFRDTARGTNPLKREQYQAIRERERPILEQARARSPVASALGDMSPELLAGTLAIATKNPKALALLGAGEGIRQRDTVQEQAIAGGIGFGLPIAGTALGRIWASANGLVDHLKTEASRRAKAIGLTTTAGEQSGGGMARAMEAAGDDIPLSGMFADSPTATRQLELNRAANAAIGQQGDVVSKANMDAAARQVGALRQGVDESIGPMRLEENLAERIREIYPRVRNRQAFDTFRQFGKDGPAQLNQGEATKLWRRMVKMADSATDSNVADDIKDEILPLLEAKIRGIMTPENFQNWRDYREMWRFHSILREGKSMTAGNVNAGALRQRLARNMPGAIHMGNLDNMTRPESARLIEMADLTGGGWLGVPNPNSGTSFRAGRAIAPGAPLVADAALMSGGLPPLATAATGGALTANAAAQGVLRAAPNLMGGVSAQRGLPSAAGAVGSYLDEVLYPFVGTEDERRP